MYIIYIYIHTYICRGLLKCSAQHWLGTGSLVKMVKNCQELSDFEPSIYSFFSTTPHCNSEDQKFLPPKKDVCI